MVEKDKRTICSLMYYAVLPYSQNIKDKITKEHHSLIQLGVARSDIAIRNLCVYKDYVLDDCNTSIACIPRETHVCLYLRLPVTLSVQICIQRLNQASTRAVRGSKLIKAGDSRTKLYKEEFLVFSGIVAPSPIGSVDTSNLTIMAEIFFTQNELNTSDMWNTAHRTTEWRGPYPPMFEGESIYE